ncbi:MAG: hypothetical protein IH936_07375 [Acidobacteria bacterium]|nr:hypothetical protein [Acidobacteriota bacterium]
MVFKHYRIAAAASVVLLAFLLYQSQIFFPYPFEVTLRVLTLLAKWLLLSAAFLGWGGLLHRVLVGADESAPLATAWALGAAATATLMGYLAPIWYPNALFVAPWLAGGIALLIRRRSRFEFRVAVSGGLLWLLAPFAACAALLALAPPLSLDALVYHLAIPKQFALRGQAFEMPWNLHSYFPQHAELLFGFTLELDKTGVLAQLLHLGAAFLTLATVVRTGRREFGRLAGTLAAVMLFSIPAYCLIAGWAWNDWFVLLYAALALDQILALRSAANRRGYLLAALFLGAAAAVKYNALPLLVLLAVGFSKRTRRFVPAATLVIVVLLGPWYGRNLLQHGNPVFPFFSSVHGAGSLTGYRGQATSSERWLGYFGRRDMIDESVGLLWIAGLPLGLSVLVSGRRRLWPLGAVAALYLASAVVFHPTVRAFGPLFLVGSWLSAQGVVLLTKRKWPRRLVFTCLAFLLWTSLSQVLWVLRHYQPLGVSLGFDRPQTYLETGHSYYPAYRWLAENTDPRDLVMVVAESRIFYLDRPAIAGSYLDPPVFSGFLREPSAEAAATRLRAAGVSHIFVNWEQYRVAPTRPTTTNELLFYSDPGIDVVFKNLLAGHTNEVFEQGPVRIYRLSSSDLLQ